MNIAAIYRRFWVYATAVLVTPMLAGCQSSCSCTSQVPFGASLAGCGTARSCMPCAFDLFWGGLTHTSYYGEPRFVGQPDDACAGFHATEWRDLGDECGDPFYGADMPFGVEYDPPIELDTIYDTAPRPAESLPAPKRGPEFPETETPSAPQPLEATMLTHEQEAEPLEPCADPLTSTARMATPARHRSGTSESVQHAGGKIRSAQYTVKDAPSERPVNAEEAIIEFDTIEMDYDQAISRSVSQSDRRRAVDVDSVQSRPTESLPLGSGDVQQEGPQSREQMTAAEPVDTARLASATQPVNQQAETPLVERKTIQDFNPVTDSLIGDLSFEVTTTSDEQRPFDPATDSLFTQTAVVAAIVDRVPQEEPPADTSGPGCDKRRESPKRAAAKSQDEEHSRSAPARFEVRFVDSPPTVYQLPAVYQPPTSQAATISLRFRD